MTQNEISALRGNGLEVRFIRAMVARIACLMIVLLSGCEPMEEKRTRAMLENTRRANDVILSVFLYHEQHDGRFPEQLEDTLVVAEGPNDELLMQKNLFWIDPDDFRESPWTYRIKDRPASRGGPVAIIEAKRPDGTVVIVRAVDREGSVPSETLSE